VESDGEEAESDDELMVTLGFAQPVEQPWKMSRQQFPCKIGGAPAWLDPVKIPEGENTQCGICGNPLQFLVQVYAPIGVDDAVYRDEVFHRSLFLFVCPDMACLQQDQHHQRKKGNEKPCRSVKVFRSQLPRTNRFYSYEPPSVESEPTLKGVPVCTWCGTWKATSRCGGCKQVRYCSRTHQLAHWRAGHDSFCRSVQAELASSNQQPDSRETSQSSDAVQKTVAEPPQKPGIVTAASDKLWPEMELIVGEGEESSPSGAQSASTEAQKLLEDYETRRAKNGEEFSATDMQDVEESSLDQQQWAAFQARLARAPGQVLRYCRAVGAKPLWPSLQYQPKEGGLPACQNCGGSRMFEFQLLPQLLYYLGVQNETDTDSLDWATIAVYTCAASCNKSESSCEGYVEEFAWVQLAVT
jgi:pre-rRNA-processing protein TSR4